VSATRAAARGPAHDRGRLPRRRRQDSQCFGRRSNRTRRRPRSTSQYLILFFPEVEFYQPHSIFKVTLKDGVAEVHGMQPLSAQPSKTRSPWRWRLCAAGVSSIQGGEQADSRGDEAAWNGEAPPTLCMRPIWSRARKSPGRESWESQSGPGSQRRIRPRCSANRHTGI